jgi:hypothetical protein
MHRVENPPPECAWWQDWPRPGQRDLTQDRFGLPLSGHHLVVPGQGLEVAQTRLVLDGVCSLHWLPAKRLQEPVFETLVRACLWRGPVKVDHTVEKSPFMEDSVYENLVRSAVMFLILNSKSAAKKQYSTRLGLNSGSLKNTALTTLIFGAPGSKRLARCSSKLTLFR